MTLELKEIEITIKNLMQLLNSYGKSKTPPHPEDFESFFYNELKMTRNIKPLCSSLMEFINTITHLQTELIEFKYNYKKKLLTIDPDESRAAIYFEIDGSHQLDKNIHCQVSASFHFVEGKIKEWNEVLYTKGIGKEIFNYS